MAEEQQTKTIQEIIPSLVKRAEDWRVDRAVNEETVQDLVVNHLASFGERFYLEGDMTLLGYTRHVVNSAPRLTRLAMDYVKSVTQNKGEEKRKARRHVSGMMLGAVDQTSPEYLEFKEAIRGFIEQYGEIELTATMEAIVDDDEDVVVTDLEVS